MPKEARPQFHFTAEAGWINDPHAITYRDGHYHHFYQYVQGQTEWDLGCGWGHAVGDDLFSLRETAPALMPGDGDDGVWSGTLFTDSQGQDKILFTSISRESPGDARIRVATPDDADWSSWTKAEFIADAPEGVSAFRDPVVVRIDGVWRMLVGIETEGGLGGAEGFVSVDGISWADTGVAVDRESNRTDAVWTGSMWECPQVIEVDGHLVIVVSVWNAGELHDVVYSFGEFNGDRFVPASWKRLSYGTSLYAATVFRDAAGNPGMMFWLRGVQGAAWAGAHSLPYELHADGDVLILVPHPDLDRYRRPLAAGGFRAAHVTWPAAGGRLQLLQHGLEVVGLARQPGQAEITMGGETFRFPCAGATRIVIDGPIIEVCSAAGLFASPLADDGSLWSLTGIEAEELHR